MEVYLVGGAVRDKLLNLPVKEKDWVVVNGTPEEMIKAGYNAVGKAFPVFLHPNTKEEYALARTEKKKGTGYYGFDCYYKPGVTLEEDLLRRDLTINAMAEDTSGKIIDPFNGQSDIKEKKLRHVSRAFIEDPVRLLRVARFASQFHFLGFTVANETMEMLRQLSKSGELDCLVPERVWQEMYKSLTTNAPWIFFEILSECNALSILFPELAVLDGVPNPKEHHPEIDSWIHTKLVLEQACLLSNKPEVRFAALVHDLGKGLTPKEHWPKHRGHEQTGLSALKQMGKRLRIPSYFMQLAKNVTQYHGLVHRALELNPGTVLKLLLSTDALRKPERFMDMLLACQADSRGRTGYEQVEYPQAEYLKQALVVIQDIDVGLWVKAELTGSDIAKKLEQVRIDKLTEFKKKYKSS